MPFSRIAQALIDRLYDHLARPAAMDAFVESLVEVAGLHSAALLIRQEGTLVTQGNWTCGLSLAAQRAYGEDYAHEDMLALKLKTLPPGRFYCSNLDLSADENAAIQGGRFIAEWARPNGIEYAAAALISSDAGWHTELYLSRSARQKPFTRAELDSLEPVLPQLRRAVPIYQRLSKLEFDSSVIGKSLDVLRLPTILFSETGLVAHLNANAQRLVQSDALFRLHDGRFTAGNQEEACRLSAMVYQAIQASLGEVEASGEVATLARVGQMPYMLLIFPLCLPTVGLQRGAALAVIFDPERPLNPSREILGRLFDLSPAETELAAQLCTGASLSDVAESRGVSSNTIKTQLKSLFGKTGTNRQAELVAALLASPAYVLQPSKMG